MLTVEVPVLRVSDGVTDGVAPNEIEPVGVLLGVMVDVMVALGEFVMRAVTEEVKVFEGVVEIVLVGVLEAVIEADGVFVLVEEGVFDEVIEAV
jgi:hypothetical protein